MRRLLLSTLLILSAVVCVADEKKGPERWAEKMAEFAEADSKSPPPENEILFVGSSSIRLWKTNASFPDTKIINRGFGGSQISDVNHYFEQVVLKYKPRTIVFYAGDNDINAGESVETVVGDYERFLARVKQDLPETHVLYLPIKPSIKRWKLWPTMRAANAQIRQLCLESYRWHYVDTATPMLDEDLRPAKKWFSDDDLHLNDAGYALWTGLVHTALEKVNAIGKQEIAKGRVYHDKNRNQTFDDGEQRLPAIKISNGRDLVVTNNQGEYEIPVDDDDTVFVIKPRGWRTPISEHQLPRFYYTHKPKGSPDFKYAGVQPTGPLPEQIDFALYPQEEPKEFRAIMFGDPQPRDRKELEYIAHDVVEELVGVKASFGVTLGDIAFDDLTLLEEQSRVIALVGIPWYNVIGNHDINFDAADDKQSDETFERVFGPNYYSFDYGEVHFLVLDDVMWTVPQKGKRGKYHGGLGKEQMEFIRNDLGAIPENQLVVLMMHIPLVNVADRQELYRLIEQRPFSMSISGHTHHHEHRLITKADGWRGAEPHHHVINVTVSGSWWSGSPDERGIPHTMMADGAPNGYSIVTFDGHKYRVDFKAAGRPADYQMNIHVKEAVSTDEAAETTLHVNVFNGSDETKVRMQVGKEGPWQELEKTRALDPVFMDLVKREGKTLTLSNDWRRLPRPKPSTHLWKGKLPADLKPGLHLITIEAVDRNGRKHNGHRVIRITADTPSGG